MNNKFVTQKEAVIKSIKDLIKPDMNKEQIDSITAICSQVDELAKCHEETQKDLDEIKDAYINQVKNEGSKEPPKDNGGEPPKARTLEEIAQEVLSKK